MNKKTIKQTVAATLLTSSIFSFSTITYGKENIIQQSIDAVKLEMKKAPLYYVDPALKSVIEPSKDLYPVLNDVKKHYNEVKKQINSSNLSLEEKKDKIKELDSLYEEKVSKGIIPYIDAYNYAVKYLDPILKEMLAAHAAGDLKGVEQAYHKLSYQLDSRTSILYRFTGKAPRDLLLEKYKKPSDAKREELRIPITIYMKNNEVLRLWNEGKKEEARKVMDEVLALVSKTSNNTETNYSNLLSKEVKEAEALFASNPIPQPEVPNNPPTNGGGSDTPSESSAQRALRLAKSNAITELEKYLEASKGSYSTTNWSTISSLKTTWSSTIHSATTPSAVAQALSDAKAEINQVKTIDQDELDEAKTQAITELSNYKEAIKDNYSTTNWSTISSLKTTWSSTIHSATTPSAVAQALSDAKAEIDQVKTIDQDELDKAKTQAFAELSNYKEAIKDNYSTTNWSTISSLKTTWTSTILSATTPSAVAQALSDAKAEIDQVKTIDQDELNEAKTQAITELSNYKEAIKDNYSTTNWSTISSLKTTWSSTIHSATTPSAVAQALSDAKAEIDQVKTIDQDELDEAKTQAITELSNYKEAIKDNYSTTNWSTISSLKTTWSSRINSATTQTEVAQALSDAKAEIDQVKTIAQDELDEAKTQAITELSNYKEAIKDNYSTTNWSTISSLKTTWSSRINSATTQTEVAQALSDAKVAIDQIAVKSNVSTINGITVKNVLALVDNFDLNVYNVTLPKGTVLANLTESDIITTLTNINAEITMTTTDGGSTWKIVVTSEDGRTTNTYKLNITITPQ